MHTASCSFLYNRDTIRLPRRRQGGSDAAVGSRRYRAVAPFPAGTELTTRATQLQPLHAMPRLHQLGSSPKLYNESFKQSLMFGDTPNVAASIRRCGYQGRTTPLITPAGWAPGRSTL